VVESGEDFSDGGGVGDHADGSHDFGEVTSGDNGGGLVVDSDLESGGAPVNELDGSLGFDGGNGGIDVFGDDISSVEHGAGHVFSVSGVAFGHHGGGFKGGVGDFGNGELFVVGLFSGDDGGIGGKHEVDSGVGDQVGLEFSDINVEGSVESEGGSQGRDNLGNESVEVGVGGSFDVQLSSADIVDGFVVEHDSDIGVFQEGVGGKNGVVGFNNSGGDLGGGVHGESDLGFFTVVNGESFEKKRSQSRSGSSSDGVEDHESLETSAVISEFSDSVEAKVNNFFSDGVVSSGEVVGGVFLSGDQLFGVEQLSVGSGSHFINDGGFQIEEHSSGHVLSGSSFTEESVEGIISSSDGLVRGHLSVRLDSVFQAEEFPAGVTHLDTALSDVN